MSRRWAWTLALFAILALPAPALADHAGSLAAQWHLDVKQGAGNGTTPDSSGHGLTAAGSGSEALTIDPGGRFGNHLSAAAAGAVSPAPSALLRPQRVTLLGWVRRNGAPGVLRHVAGQGDDGLACGGSSYALYTGTGAGDGLRFYIRPPVGPAQVSPAAGNGIWDNQWHMVAGVYDGSRVRLYVDGVQQGGGTPLPGATINYGLSGSTFSIHDYPISSCGGGDWDFTGGVDEVRVYRRALSSTEIARLAAPGPNPPALVPDAPGVPLPKLPPLATPRFVTTKAVKLARATWLSGAVSSVPAGVKIDNYEWDFNGDGRYDGTCDGDTPAASHAFRRAGIHMVGLRLTDQYGRTSVITRAVTVSSAQRNLAKLAVSTCEDPATNGNQPDRKDCIKTFFFSIIAVNGQGAINQCFTLKSRSPFLSQKAGSSQAAERDRDTKVYNAKIAGPVKLNGLPIPVPRQRITEYDSGNATISAGNVPVKILLPIPGSTPITLANVPLEHKIKPTKGRFKLPPLKGSGKLGGLKLGGGIEVHLLQQHAADVFVSLKLPQIFKFGSKRDAEGRVTLRTTNKGGVQLEGLRISGIPEVFLGPLFVKGLFFEYQRTGEIWRGGANFQLAAVSPVEIKAAPPPPEYGFGLKGGGFDYAGGGIAFEFPPRPQLFPGIGLVEIGGSIGIDPIRFTGRMAVDVGGLFVVDGSSFIGFASEDQPYDFPEEFAPPGLGILAGRRLDTVSFAIGGQAKIKVPVIGDIPLLNAYVFYQYPAIAEFGGGFKFNVGDRLSLDGNMSGFLAPIQRTFNLEGNVKGCVDIEITKFCLNVGTVVSSKGIGFCAVVPIPISPFGPVIPVPAGVGYTWGGSVEPKVFSCDTGPYKEARPSARTAQSGGTFTLPSGLPSAMVRVTGRGGVPRVELRGPKGQRILAPQDDRSLVRNDVVVIPQTREKRLLIGIKKPAAGRWSVVARPGSAPIAGVASANGLPAPRIRASVRGRGRKRLLSYRIAPAAGQRVTFFEKGVRTYRRLGVARGRRGRIRFAPAAGRRGRRQIVAQIERNGVVVKNLVVARYSAARDPRPARPRGLRVRRRGDSLVIAWRRARAAFRYGVTVQLSNRRRIFRVTRRRKITIRGVDRRARGVVFVGGIRGDGVSGREAQRRIPKPKRTKRRKR